MIFSKYAQSQIEYSSTKTRQYELLGPRIVRTPTIICITKVPIFKLKKYVVKVRETYREYIHAVFFIRNKPKSQLVVFLILPKIFTSFCFLAVS